MSAWKICYQSLISLQALVKDWFFFDLPKDKHSAKKGEKLLKSIIFKV